MMPAAFTQGLQWHDGRLFESTGEVGTSGIREVELTTGRVIRQQELEAPHFGEGIVILGEKLYELTWTTGKAFVYDWKTFTRDGRVHVRGRRVGADHRWHVAHHEQRHGDAGVARSEDVCRARRRRGDRHGSR